MFKGYIYRHWLINDKGQEKSYIGQTTEDNVENRWGKNGKGYLGKRKGKEDDHKFARAIRKYGWDSFSHEILLTIQCETLEELVFWLDEWEKYYIEKYDSFYNGYNSTAGGSNGIRGEETRRKISDSLMGRFVGKDNPCAIKVVCLTTNMIFDCVIDAAKWCNKSSGDITSCCKGKTKSAGKHPKTNEPLQWAYYEDYINGNYTYQTYNKVMEEVRKQQSERMKEKYSEGKAPNKKSVVCLNTGQVFESTKEATEWCHGSKSSICMCCQRKPGRFQAGKHPETGEMLQWAYYEDYINGNYEFKNSKELEEQHRQKHKEKMKGKYDGNKNPRARAVICLETLDVFNTVKEAQNTYKINNVTACCKGKLKTAGGYHWQYYDDYLKLQEEQSNKTQDLVTNVA